MESVFRRAGVPAFVGFAVLAGALVAVPEASAGDAAAPQTMQELVRLPAADLAALYSASPAASAPSGFVPGRAIKNPGSRTTVANARATRLVWQGKIFRDDGTMINRVFGAGRAIPADVYVGESLLDGQRGCIWASCTRGRRNRSRRCSSRSTRGGRRCDPHTRNTRCKACSTAFIAAGEREPSGALGKRL
jgi:hypothetical protein